MEFTDWLILIAVIALSLIIQYYFLQYVFSVKKQLWNQKQQINLLIKIAEKSGANDEEVNTIKKENNPPEEKGFFDIS